MISNAFIFIFGLLVLFAWLVSFFMEFKKMDDQLEDYERSPFTSFDDQEDEI